MCALVTGVQTCALPILVDLTLALSHCSFTTSTSAGNLSGHALKPSDMKAAATNNVTANPYQGPATAKRSESHERKVAPPQSARPKPDRKSALQGRGGPVSVDLGGRRLLKKQKPNRKTQRQR